MNTVNIGGRVIAVSPKEYDRIMAKRRELEGRGRQLSRELRYEGPREYGNPTRKITGSSHAPTDTVEVSDRAQWLADKSKRLHQDFETFKPRTPNLSRMNEAFSRISASA